MYIIVNAIGYDSRRWYWTGAMARLQPGVVPIETMYPEQAKKFATPAQAETALLAHHIQARLFGYTVEAASERWGE